MRMSYSPNMFNADKNQHLGLLNYHCKGHRNRVSKREFRCLNVNNKKGVIFFFPGEDIRKSQITWKEKQTNPAQQIEAKNKNKKQLKLTDVTLPRYQVANKETTEI